MNKNTKIIIIVSSIIFLIVAGVSVFFLFFNKEKAEEPKEEKPTEEKPIVNEDDTEEKFVAKEITNTEVEKLFSYVVFDGPITQVGNYYENPFSSYSNKDKIELAITKYTLLKFRKEITTELDTSIIKELESENKYEIPDNLEAYIELTDVKDSIKYLFNMDLTDNEILSYGELRTCPISVPVESLKLFGLFSACGGDYGRDIVQAITDYKETSNEITVTTVKAEQGYEDDKIYYNKTKVIYDNLDIENFEFTNENIELFPQLKYVFKKNNSDKYYLYDIVKLNF